MDGDPLFRLAGSSSSSRGGSTRSRGGPKKPRSASSGDKPSLKRNSRGRLKGVSTSVGKNKKRLERQAEAELEDGLLLSDDHAE